MRSLCLLIACLLVQSLTAQHWQVSEVTPMPERVSNNAVAEGFVNGVPYLYSFGGIDSTKTHSGIHLRSFRYNTQDDQWETIAPLPDTLGKIAAAASRVDDIIYIIGGYHVYSNSNEKSSETVHRYDIASNSYLSDGTPIPVPIDDQVQAVWRDSLIYVVTGWSETRNVNDVQIYDPASDEWTVGTALPNSNAYPSFGSSGVIVGDTIYYYGGAANGTFGPQANFRKGIINPDNPSEITWSASLPNATRRGYRMAATTVGEEAFWIGGSKITYNFDGLAYSNGNGVPPANRSLRYNTTTRQWDEDNSNDFPMDLRGIGNISSSIKYIAGGMLAGQSVSNKAYRLEWADDTSPVASIELENPITIYPNPTEDHIRVELNPALLPINGLLMNAEGKLVQFFKCENPSLELNIAKQPAGIYWLYFSHKGQAIVRKIVRL